MSESGQNERAPITDSTWFWILLFSLAALAGLLAIRPKFERREQAIETKFHARERAFGREAKEQLAEPSGDAPAPGQRLWRPAFTLGPIAAVIGIVAIVALAGVLRFHRRSRAAMVRDRAKPRAEL